MDNKSPTPAELTILIAGAVMLVASFLDFGGDTSTWGKYLFPIATLATIVPAILFAFGGRQRALLVGRSEPTS